MRINRAQPFTALSLHARAVDDETVELKPSDRDPFRAPGVPERLVLVLHREGRYYTGTLSTWEYQAIDVRRDAGPGEHARVVREMVVDTSTPNTSTLLVRMLERPTAARLVAELVEVLREMVPGLAGRDRRMPPRMAQGRVVTSGRHELQEPPIARDRVPPTPGAHGGLV